MFTIANPGPVGGVLVGITDGITRAVDKFVSWGGSPYPTR
jgi:hypothetical protein